MSFLLVFHSFIVVAAVVSAAAPSLFCFLLVVFFNFSSVPLFVRAQLCRRRRRCDTEPAVAEWTPTAIATAWCATATTTATVNCDRVLASFIVSAVSLLTAF